MKKLFSALLILSLVLLPVISQAEAPYAAAFTEGKTLTLEKVDLPGAQNDWMPVSISPDGRTVLWGPGVLTRDGQVIPLTVNRDRGAGDPYEALEKNLMGIFRSLPGQEGINWSPDGRYALLNCKRAVLQNNKPLGLMVLDAETGEVFQAVAVSRNLLKEGGGFVIEAKFDHTGRYVYFTGYLSSIFKGYGLFRCDMETYEVQLVSGNMNMASTAGLFETPEGCWLMLDATERTNRAREAVYLSAKDPIPSAMLPLYETMAQTGYPIGVDQSFIRQFSSGAWQTGCLVYSSVSGYGLMIGGCLMAASNTAAMEGNLADTWRPSTVLNNMNLCRITPEGPDMQHYWHFVDDSGDLTGVRLEPVDDGIVSELVRMEEESRNGVTPEASDALGAYNIALIRNPQPFSTCGCVSPDGRFALINAGVSHRGVCGFFLVDMETMEMRPVNAPEGMATIYLNSALTRKYQPGMVWNQDGTLLIFNYESQTVEAWTLDCQ